MVPCRGGEVAKMNSLHRGRRVEPPRKRLRRWGTCVSSCLCVCSGRLCVVRPVRVLGGGMMMMMVGRAATRRRRRGQARHV